MAISMKKFLKYDEEQINRKDICNNEFYDMYKQRAT